MLNEIKKIELKRQAWNNQECCLIVDSLNDDTINLNFQVIDNGLYGILDNMIKPTKMASENYQTKRVDTNYITKLTKGKLVRWG